MASGGSYNLKLYTFWPPQIPLRCWRKDRTYLVEIV